MTSTWIAVVHEEGATLYSSAGPGMPLTIAYRVPNRWGSAAAAEHMPRRWAALAARNLDWYRAAHAFERLVLVGSSQLVQAIRAELSEATARVIVAELTEDLRNPSAAELRHKLGPVVQL